MKKRLLTTIAALSIAASGVAGTSSELSTRLSVVDQSGGGSSTESWDFDYTYYFKPLVTGGAPLNELSFVNRIASLDLDFHTDGYKVYGGEYEYADADSNHVFRVGYSTVDGSDTDFINATYGYYIADNTRLSLTLDYSDWSGGHGTVYTVEYRDLKELANAGTWFATRAWVSIADMNYHDYASAGVGVNYYLNETTDWGASVEYSDGTVGSNLDVVTISLSGNHYFTDTMGLGLEVARNFINGPDSTVYSVMGKVRF